ncbi:nuclease-like protein [Nitzschia inconspicua]|uniref:Nuclease-like protein n=1 Tax=Nitzschia inconspicua TaxID=303405 RepID=A0A9K3KV03_9STRA|nr:nuclease-like protein [Nitzschia inconspicua]
MGTCLSILTQVLEQHAESSTTSDTAPKSAATTTSGSASAVVVAAAVPSSSSGGSSNNKKNSPVYDSLPNGAKKFAVRNVYDGDTLTLVDERRVRVIGVDTPEMKPSPPQPYAEDAKEYTKSRCDKTDIWLLIDGEDHYGRLLAHIFVEQDGGGYLCIGEGLVQQGFAHAYSPNKAEKPFNWDKLVSIQSEAMAAKRGIWNNFNDEMVVKTANGSAYHKRSCEHISTIRNLQEMKVSAATVMGLHPCRTCMADP